MPVYTYRCKDCNREFEVYCKTSENHCRTCCDKCGGTSDKIPSKLSYRYRFNDK